MCRYANHADASISDKWRHTACSDGVGEQTAPVGRYEPNGFGLHDMHGNVSEWVEDCSNDSYEGAPLDGSAWRSSDCSDGVLRGGSWSDIPWDVRSASRGWSPVGGRSYDFGFRVARTLAP